MKDGAEAGWGWGEFWCHDCGQKTEELRAAAGGGGSGSGEGSGGEETDTDEEADHEAADFEELRRSVFEG